MSQTQQIHFSRGFRDANWLNRLFFIYVHPIFKQCKSNDFTLKDEHLFDMKFTDDETMRQFETFSDIYKQKKLLANPNQSEKDILMATIVTMFKWDLIFICLLSFLSDALSLFFSYYIKYLILFLKDEHATGREGALKAVIFVLALIISSISRNQVFYLCIRKSLVLKKLMILLIYDKISKMRAYNLQDSIISKQISLMSSEFIIIERQSFNIPVIFTLPFLTLAVIALVYYEMGWEGALIVLAASTSLVIIALFNKRVALKVNLSFGKQGDKILITIRNILSGIQVLKCYCLENHYISKLTIDRKKYSKFAIINNILLLQRDVYLSSFGVLAMIPIIALLNSENGYLENSQVMGIFSLVIILFRQINYVFLLGLMIMVRFQSAIIRLSEITQLKDTFEVEESNSKGIAPVISIEDGTFSWSGNYQENEILQSEEMNIADIEYKGFLLQNINFKISSGLLVVIGKVGCGKSSLLNVMLKETIQHQGNKQLIGTISYVEQDPYLITGTIKENILFGGNYDEVRFSNAIKYSCLKSDIKSFPQKEETIIGDKGRTLSGGQRARLSLARAIYKNSDIYLFDDPLSAVDPKVASKIFNQCIKEFLKDKIVVLVTHQIQFLQNCEKILVLEKGCQKFLGSYSEIISQGYNLEDFVENQQRNSNVIKCSSIKENFQTCEINERTIVLSERNELDQCIENLTEEATVNEEYIQNDQNAKDGSEMSRISIGIRTYFNYFSFYAGWVQLLYFAFILILTSVFRLAPSYVLSKWSNLEDNEQSQGSYYLIFCLCVAGQFITSFISATTLISLIVLGNQKIFIKTIKTLLFAVPNYFDKTHSGSIITLFSKDFSILDCLIIPQINGALQGFFYSLIGMIVVAVVIPYLAIPFAIIIIIFVILMQYIRIPFREAQRLETFHRGPLHQNIIQTMQGITQIRSIGAFSYFRERLLESLELGTNASFTDRMMSRWFNNTLDYIIVVFTSLTICLSMGLKGTIEVSLISYTMQVVIEIAIQFSIKIRGFSEVDNSILSAYRTFEFCETQSEDAIVKENDKNLEYIWPKEPTIEFKDVNLLYRKDSTLALKGVSFKIQSGMRVGIVGRTGAGKSSILQAVLRLVEIEEGGQIIIDGIDTKTIGLHLLRKNIGYIPQSPYLMEGTIQQNLDPTGGRTAQEIIDSLKKVQLWDYINSMNNKLDTNLQDFNQIFSVGQQQLFCLARALLQNCKFLVVDEATANVDYETDAKIQIQLRDGFVGCTLMIIAHRLKTVIDCDKILVMDDGKSLEFDHPFNLLAENEDDTYISKKSLFAEMVKATGLESSKSLFNSAKASFRRKQLSHD